MKSRIFVILALALAHLSPTPIYADTASVIAKAKSAVVFIRHRSADGNQCTGSGFIISPAGYLVTCAHVVEPSSTSKKGISDKVWVRLSDDTTHEAKTYSLDDENDIAILRLPGRDYNYLMLEQTSVAQGQDVFVLGYPLGQALGKEMVVTRGIISAIRAGGSVLQMDAAMNPGNSGGPILNDQGCVIGIAFARIADFQGTNFAVSASLISLPKDAQLSKESLNDLSPDDYLPEKPGKVDSGLSVDIKDNDVTSLFQAVSHDMKDVVRLLLSKGADLEAKDKDGGTPLFSASNKEMAQLLISKGANINAKSGTNGRTALHSTGDIGVAEALIEAGLSVDVKDNNGVTPLFQAVYWNRREIVELLLSKGADVNAKAKDGQAPLFDADSVEIAKMLLDKGADVNVGDTDGEKPLFFARSREIAQFLLDKGANLYAKDDYDNTALFAVANKEVAELLIDKGLRIDATNKDGAFPISYNQVVEVCDVYLSKGSDVNAKDKWKAPPLCRSLKKEKAEWLLSKGADLNVRDKDEATPLFWAAWWDNKEMVDFFLDKGLSISAENNYSETALHYAAKNDCAVAAEALIARGADVNAKDDGGNTPLKDAVKDNKNKVAEVLRNHGGVE
ncbi:MAG: ankyrin repeat domain-containing protein [Armatimonadota bacterium]|nr:ankyrin repeat domain-containing protein [Armatimonadota bacterium]